MMDARAHLCTVGRKHLPHVGLGRFFLPPLARLHGFVCRCWVGSPGSGNCTAAGQPDVPVAARLSSSGSSVRGSEVFVKTTAIHGA